MIMQLIRAVARFLSGCVRVPFDIAADVFRMLGLVPDSPCAPPREGLEDLIDAQSTELRQQLTDAPRAVKTAPDMTQGEAIHAYAAGSPHYRETFDMSKVSTPISIALLTMTQAQLTRLELAGPTACGKWAEGGKGIVGVPLPDRAGYPAVAPVAQEESDDAPAMIASR